MVFDGSGPLVKQCNGFDGSLWPKNPNIMLSLIIIIIIIIIIIVFVVAIIIIIISSSSSILMITISQVLFDL